MLTSLVSARVVPPSQCLIRPLELWFRLIKRTYGNHCPLPLPLSIHRSGNCLKRSALRWIQKTCPVPISSGAPLWISSRIRGASHYLITHIVAGILSIYSSRALLLRIYVLALLPWPLKVALCMGFHDYSGQITYFSSLSLAPDLFKYLDYLWYKQIRLLSQHLSSSAPLYSSLGWNLNGAERLFCAPASTILTRPLSGTVNSFGLMPSAIHLSI